MKAVKMEGEKAFWGEKIEEAVYYWNAYGFGTNETRR